MMKQLWKTVEELLIKVNSHSSSDPETFLLNSYLREMKNMSTKRCAEIHKEAYFQEAKT